MLFIDRRRRGCGKCGKAEAFFAEAFPSSLWKSSRRSCRRLPFSISTAAAFSTAPRARRFFRFVDEEIDIRNGKDSSKVRSRIQTSTDRANRGRGVDRRSGGTRSAAITKPGRAMAHGYHLHSDSFQLRLSGCDSGSLFPQSCRLGYLQFLLIAEFARHSTTSKNAGKTDSVLEYVIWEKRS
jgi:hypothetical protein